MESQTARAGNCWATVCTFQHRGKDKPRAWGSRDTGQTHSKQEQGSKQASKKASKRASRRGSFRYGPASREQAAEKMKDSTTPNLRKVLRLEPNNEAARRELEKLEARSRSPGGH